VAGMRKSGRKASTIAPPTRSATVTLNYVCTFASEPADGTNTATSATDFTVIASVTALTLASETVSFTKVIESSPGLRRLDALGRPPRSSHGDPLT